MHKHLLFSPKALLNLPGVNPAVTCKLAKNCMLQLLIPHYPPAEPRSTSHLRVIGWSFVLEQLKLNPPLVTPAPWTNVIA